MASAYCARADIEAIYGTTNVATWGDLDADGDTDKITARITWAIESASNELEDRLRGGPLEVPISPVPQTILELTAYLAGVILYEARGVTDFESETGTPYHRLQWHRDRVDKVITQILSGQRKMSGSTHPEVPHVVK